MSYSILNVNSTATEIELPRFDKTYLEFYSDRINGNFRETIYTVAVGDALKPTYVILRRTYDPKGDTTKFEWRLETRIAGSDLEVDVLDGKTITGVVQLIVPGTALFDAALGIAMITNTMSLVWNMETDGAPQHDALNAVNHGTVNNLY